MLTKTPNLSTTLPQSLRNPQDIAKIKKGVTQWSQLVAWSWTDVLAFEGNPEKEQQEKTLKSFFIQTAQRQAQSHKAFVSYGIPQAEKESRQLAIDFKNLLFGDHHKIPFLQEQGITLTLSNVLKKLSGREFVAIEEREFFSKFTSQIVTDRCTGSVHQLCDEMGNLQDKYISVLAYPQKPILSEATVTEKQLTDWAKNTNTGGRYLPPSVYIPIASC